MRVWNPWKTSFPKRKTLSLSSEKEMSDGFSSLQLRQRLRESPPGGLLQDPVRQRLLLVCFFIGICLILLPFIENSFNLSYSMFWFWFSPPFTSPSSSPHPFSSQSIPSFSLIKKTNRLLWDTNKIKYNKKKQKLTSKLDKTNQKERTQETEIHSFTYSRISSIH